MNSLNADTSDDLLSLLELAANNDVEAFKQSIECNPSSIDRAGLWYCRQMGSKQMVYLHRTPLMVASTYGSIDVVKLILSLSIVDVNQSCGLDKTTALHCAASGGSSGAVDVVKLLIKSGADVNALDIHCNRPVDVISVSPNLQDLKSSMEDLLRMNGPGSSIVRQVLRVSTTSTPNSNTPPLSSSPGNVSPSSTSGSPPSPVNTKFDDHPTISYVLERKEYQIDPSLPDIKNSIYATDEFRMYQFKVRPCSRAYSHDWTECPFVHPGENARRRDPRKYHYSCVPCPEFRKASCRRGDMCEYAHGVFECWLHPAQYRTRLCKDGTSCYRRVCFFAHTVEELRPLYSMASGLASPRSASSASAMDFGSAINLFPGSPSSVMSPSAFTPPMSPSANGGWPPQQDVPSLHLPGSNLQSSRLRSSTNARDMISSEDFDIQQRRLLGEMSMLSMNRSIRTLNPSNLDDLFSSESSSPRYSPTHKSALFNQFQQQQGMLSPISTSCFSPRNTDRPFLQASSSGRMSPRSMDPISPMSARTSSVLGPLQFRSLGSRDLNSNASAIVGSPVNSWSNNNRPDLDWSVDRNEPNGEEPDLSWVQSLVKESPNEVKEKAVSWDRESNDQSVIDGWIEQLQT